MPRIALAILALALSTAGCLSAAPLDAADAAADAADGGPDAALPPVTRTEWSGFVLNSAVDGPSHMRPTEDALWPVQQEGFLFDVTEAPQAMEVSLAWEGAGEFMIMLHSHKEHGTNAYVEHITELDGENPKCLRVPAEDITTGEWQIMVHTEGAENTPYTIAVALAGGAGSVVEDNRHGHWLQDGMFEVEEHPIEACSLPAAPA